MADPPSIDSGDETDLGPAGGSPPGTPRWVKVSGIAALVVVLLFVVLLLFGKGGGHGPGRHSGAGRDVPPAGHVGPAAVGHGLQRL